MTIFFAFQTFLAGAFQGDTQGRIIVEVSHRYIPTVIQQLVESMWMITMGGKHHWGIGILSTKKKGRFDLQ